MASKNKLLKALHPGKVLRDDYMGTKVFANEIVMKAYPLINWDSLWSLLRCESDVDENMAEGLSQFFTSTTTKYWLDLQRRYDACNKQESVISAAS